MVFIGNFEKFPWGLGCYAPVGYTFGMKIYTRKITLFVFLFLITLAAQAKIVVISDIDDTVKQTNSMSAGGAVVHFLKNKSFEHLATIYNEIKTYHEAQGETVEFHYVSAGLDFMFNQEKFVKKSHLPEGKTYLRKFLNVSTFTFKYKKLTEILTPMLESGEPLTIYFFGDNSAHDPDVYYQIKLDLLSGTGSNVTPLIFIRDVATTATFTLSDKPALAGKNAFDIHYFLTEKNLLKEESLNFLSQSVAQQIAQAQKKSQLLPEYTYTTLTKRIRKKNKCWQKSNLLDALKCRKSAKKESKKILDSYLAQ